MEEKPKSVAMNGINYGIITGVVMILFSLILYLLDMFLNRTVSSIGYVFLIGGMIWGTLDYRKKSLNGFMTYGQAFKTSFLIGLFAAVLGLIYTYLFFTVIAPDAVQAIIEMSRQSTIESSPQLSEDEIDRAMEMSAAFMSPIMLTIWGFVSQVLISAVIALIASIFLKKEDKSMTSQSI